MDGKITIKELKQALGEDWEQLLTEVAAAINSATPGRIIADSEEPVRDATGEFRRRVYQKALTLRGKREAFSPSGDGRPPVAK